MHNYSIDYAKNPGMELGELERFLDDVRLQPEWRSDADQEADMYDGNQLQNDTIRALQDKGLAPVITNLVQPTIDLVLGMEARSRRDWVVRPADTGDEESVETAQALNVKLNEAERLSRAKRSISDAYADQVKVGISFIEVGRETNPFLYKYRCKYVHRRELFWDWRAVEPDLSDARYMIRRKWYDVDQLVAGFPKQKDLIEGALRTEASWDWSRLNASVQMQRDWANARDSDIEEMEWRDTLRLRLCAYEVWYKVWTRGYVLKLPGDRVIEFDKTNQKHMEVVAAGLVKPEIATFPKIRVSFWIGPYRLMDFPNPYPFNRFPYVPFFGRREDRTGIPYGMIRAMKTPQEEINARRTKMMWLLSARRVVTDEDAVANGDHQRVMKEVARADAYIKLNPARTNRSRDAFRIEDDIGMSIQQFNVYQDAKDMLQSSAGVFQSMLGKGETGQSGRAISQLVDQGSTTLGEVNDNFQFSSQIVGEMKMALVKEDLSKEQNIAVSIKSSGRKKSNVVYLNNTQEGGKRNDLMMLKTEVVLDDVPSTPTFQAQQLQELKELFRSLPVELQMPLFDMVIEATDLKNKNEMAERIRAVTGVEEKDEEQEITDEERQAQEAEAFVNEIKMRMMELEVEDKEGSIEEKAKKIELIDAQIRKVIADIGSTEEQNDLKMMDMAIKSSQQDSDEKTANKQRMIDGLRTMANRKQESK